MTSMTSRRSGGRLCVWLSIRAVSIVDPHPHKAALAGRVPRKNALFAGSDRGGSHWAVIASLVETCKLNGVDPQAYLGDVITRIVDGHPQSRLDDLLP